MALVLTNLFVVSLQVLTNDREMKSEEKNDEDIIRPGSDSGSSEKTKKSGCCS